MAATIRTWTTATPARLAGTVTAIAAMPPRLVTKPWAEASRTWKSMRLSIGVVDRAAVALQVLGGRGLGPGQPAVAVDRQLEHPAEGAAGELRRDEAAGHRADTAGDDLAHVLR